ncbi:ribose 5-phosphate isomerase A [Neobacillus cucumis]|uniref:ribose 5-phosphate isomerase A n=1 Tax=Neobacillus cucumis TaxID=1740721 RepID=UPI002E21B710|nr:ribose 5-phosphate isomerase A [Neobacillus cucumis]MED4226873.1 ribose 5-phosphate isomerase A [Neobacillus cucumis]
MNWSNPLFINSNWTSEISNREQKEVAAEQVAKEIKNGDVIGVGSGSTSFLAIHAIANRIEAEGLSILAIPTSHEVAMACARLNIPTTSLMAHKPNWAFDGADEIDANHRMIKGRGGALFAEKIVMASANKTFILVDPSKFVDRLGEKFPVPVEVDPRAIHLVETSLKRLGTEEIKLRNAIGKDGPIITEAGNLILDVRFNQIFDDFERKIKSIPGVIESGLFIGYNVEVISV